MTRTSGQQRLRQGMTIVESALVLSMTVLLLIGIFEYGRFLMTRQVLEHAAREGSRFAVVNTYDNSTADVQDVVHNALGGLQSQLEGYSKTSSVTVYRADGNGNPHATDSNWKNAAFAEPIGVRITGNYRPVLPTFLRMGVNGSGVIPLQVTSVMYSEAN